MLGTTLDCVRCDRSELPASFVAYKKTPLFTEETVPAGLKKDHSTKTGVWAKIIVSEGILRYRVDTLSIDVELSQDRIGIVVPEVLHSVEPLDGCGFWSSSTRCQTLKDKNETLKIKIKLRALI
jgi:tellurite resistance-related uncharacterized protein